MKENKEETKLQSEQMIEKLIALAREEVKNDDVAKFASDDDLLIYEHFYIKGHEAASQFKSQLPDHEQIIDELTTSLQYCHVRMAQAYAEIERLKKESQLPIEQKNELELIIAEKNIDIIHLRDRIKELESQPSPIEQKPRFSDTKYWDDLFMFTTGNEDRAAMQAANHVWDKFVVPLLQSQPLPIEGVEREQLREAFEAGQHADEYDQWVKHNYDFDEWLATRKGSKSGE